jgi:AbrB family looped-hinge helix DNA binding protein
MTAENLPDNIANLPSKSAKIRALNARGMARAEIARLLGIRYQFVRNVLIAESARKAERKASVETVQMDAAGRILIPAGLRTLLNIGEGSQVRIEMDGESLKLTPRDAAVKHAQKLISKFLPEDAALSDELIAERREAARNE